MSTAADMSIQPTSRVARSEAIVFTELGDVTVMMDAELGNYYELNAVGAKIWALAEFRPRFAEVCEALVAEFEVATETCADEVHAFMDELLRLEVIRIRQRDSEIGNGDLRGVPAKASVLGHMEAPDSTGARRHGREAEGKLAWTTPAIRVMKVNRTASGPDEYINVESVQYHPNPIYLQS